MVRRISYVSDGVPGTHRQLLKLALKQKAGTKRRRDRNANICTANRMIVTGEILVQKPLIALKYALKYALKFV